MYAITVWLAATLGVILGAPMDQKVESLPGLTFTPNFHHYSGYLNLTDDMLHYWLMESQSMNATEDPLIVWISGGPRCSVMNEVMNGNGPFRLSDDMETVHENVYSWNKVANMLYLDVPAGVGFSYSEQPRKMTDKMVIETLLGALFEFYERYPEYQNRSLYLGGESAASIYVLGLAQMLNYDSGRFPVADFKGLIVGNGFMDKTINFNSIMEQVHNTGLMDPSNSKELMSACCQKKCVSECNFMDQVNDEQCRSLIVDMLTQLYSMGLDPYNASGNCYAHDRTSFQFLNMLMPYRLSNMKLEVFTQFRPNNMTCSMDEMMETYLNREDVRAALHMDNSTANFTMCNTTMKWEESPESMNMDMTVDRIIMEEKLRILFYNGDQDMLANPLAAEKFTEKLFAEKINNKKIWTDNEAIAGFWTEYKNLDLLTLRGAGHFVSQSRPAAALHMIANYVQQKAYELPTYIDTNPQPCNDPECRGNINGTTAMPTSEPSTRRSSPTGSTGSASTDASSSRGSSPRSTTSGGSRTSPRSTTSGGSRTSPKSTSSGGSRTSPKSTVSGPTRSSPASMKTTSGRMQSTTTKSASGLKPLMLTALTLAGALLLVL